MLFLPLVVFVSFHTKISEAKRFIVAYQIGTRKKAWECEDFTGQFARARFHKQPFACAAGIRVLGVFEVLRDGQ